MSRCDHCPLNKIKDAKDIPCISSYHAKYCKLSSGNSDYDKIIYEKSVARAAQQMPSWLEVAKNAGVATIRSVERIASKKPLFARPETIVARLEVCRQCDQYEPGSGRCFECGCVLEPDKTVLGLPAKTQLASEQCPRGHWSMEKAGGGGCGCG